MYAIAIFAVLTNQGSQVDIPESLIQAFNWSWKRPLRIYRKTEYDAAFLDSTKTIAIRVSLINMENPGRIPSTAAPRDHLKSSLSEVPAGWKSFYSPNSGNGQYLCTYLHDQWLFVDIMPVKDDPAVEVAELNRVMAEAEAMTRHLAAIAIAVGSRTGSSLRAEQKDLSARVCGSYNKPLVLLREVKNQLGYTTQLDFKTATITWSKGQKTGRFWLGTKWADIGGERKELEAMPIMFESEIYVPLDALDLKPSSGS